MRTLIFDIELSKAVALIYPSKKPQYIDPTNIIHHQFMPCAAWKWLDEDEITLVSVLDNKKKFKKDFRDHSDVIKKLHEAISSCDALCGHNIDRFDIKHFNWFAKLQGLEPIPKKITIDTLKETRKIWNAPSHRLDDLGERLVNVRKMKTSDGMHNRVALGCPEAIKEMGDYNTQDVVLQEKVLLDIRPYIDNYPRDRIYNQHTGELIKTCQHCSSPNLRASKNRRLKSGRMRKQYQCNDCGGYTTFELLK